MEASTVQAMLTQYFELSGSDPDLAHEIYKGDAVLEFPQSGERFVGVGNFGNGEASSRVPSTSRCGT